MEYIKFPKYLSIQTTSFCNATCIFCPYPEIENRFPFKIMDMDLYKKIIDECCNYEVEGVILNMNNEPLTDPYLVERINYAKNKLPESCVHFLTNGVSLTEELTDKLLDSKLDWIGISFHGIQRETVERTMGIPFDTTFTRINNFVEKAKKVKDLKEYIMITFLNHKYLDSQEKKEAFNYWERKGIKRISYHESPISRAGNVNSLPSPHRDRVIGCCSELTNEMIHILEDGKVNLCCMDWRREVILGDLSKKSIYNIWNGKRKDVWDMIYGKKNMPEDFLCKSCEEAIVVDENIESDILITELPYSKISHSSTELMNLFLYLRFFEVTPATIDLNKEIYSLLLKWQQESWYKENPDMWKDEGNFMELCRLGIHHKIEHCLRKIINLKFSVLIMLIKEKNLRTSLKTAERIMKIRPDIKVIFVSFDGKISYELKNLIPENLNNWDLAESEVAIPNYLNIENNSNIDYDLSLPNRKISFFYLIFITFFSFLFSFYLWMLKKVKGILIFPGT